MKIFVGNLAFGVDEPGLRSLFEPFGTVENASLATDQSTGRSRGFGFVEMANEDAAKAIAALNGKDSAGRALTVNEARPKLEHGRSRGSGRDSGPRNGRQPRW
ncbi:MAG TPA: RNA-binding protein [Candidatus Binataceae bacterium]|nr:RNA-binding protein [Candidatus Binataceae bacterium]